MSDLIEKCAVCRAFLDEEDLFCANCGTEAPHRTAPQAALTSRVTTHNFQCNGCGAAMSYDASAAALRCPFCGSTRMEKQQNAKTVSPTGVVPLAIDQQEAERRLREWLGRGFWRPDDLAREAELAKITPVYVPYWVFRAETHTFWTADSSATPRGARGDWFPMTGERRGVYNGLLVGGSGALTPAETAAICPFDLSAAAPPDAVDLDNVIVEQFGVPRKYARPLAHQGLAQLESEACRPLIPGNVRNLKVNLRVEGLASEPMLLPVWIMAYRYRDRVFRFLMNGQTGKATGHKPVSSKKITVAIVLAVAAILLVALFCLFCAGAAALVDARPSNAPHTARTFSMPGDPADVPFAFHGKPDTDIARFSA